MQEKPTAPVGPAVRGDADELETLFRSYEYRLRCFAISLFDDRPYGRSFADDITQEAFALLTARVRAGRRPEKPVGFLYRAVRNFAHETQYAHGLTKPAHVKGYKAAPTLDGEINAPRVLDECEIAEQRTSLLGALRALPPLERDIHLRADYRGDGYDEIADELGLHRSKVALTLFQARNRIAWIMETGETKGMPKTGYRKTLVQEKPARPRKPPQVNAQQRTSLVKARATLAANRARRGFAQNEEAAYQRAYRARKREQALAHA